MKFSVDFGRWTRMKTALTVAGLLGLAGAVGSALAMSPTLNAPIKWAGGWEANDVFSTGFSTLATVPQGANLIISDLAVSNFESTVAYIFVHTAGGPASDSCGSHTSKTRLNNVAVPAQSTLTIPLQTGIGFAAGQRVCLFVSSILSVNARGFLFTPAPGG